MKYFKHFLFIFLFFICINGIYGNDFETNFETDIIENNITNENYADETYLTADNISMYYKNGTRYEVQLTDSNGNNLSDREIIVTISKINYTLTTNIDGIASMAINLNPGFYEVSTFFKGDNNYLFSKTKSNISVLSTISGNDITKVFRNDTQYYVNFLDGNGNFLKNHNITFNINGVFYIRTTDEFGNAKLNINLNPGKYIITAINSYNNEHHSNNILVLSNLIDNQNIIKYYKNNTQYSIKVLNNQNGPLKSANVSFNINGVFYTRLSNMEGIATLTINLDPGNYIITATYNQLSVSNNITVLSVISAENLLMTYKDGSEFTATLINGQGKPASNEIITFNINGVFYNKTTDLNGMANLTINLNSGNYIITYFSHNISNIESNFISIKNSIGLKVYNWGTGGDLSKNSLIYNNVPNSDLLKEIVNQANYGTPLITIKGGEGNSIFLVSGIHGSELSSQIAAMNLINYLENNPISGTIYIIPFIAPSMSANNERLFNGIPLNSVANIPNTPSYNVIQLAIELGVMALGDFHCTMPGGDPGKNVAMGTYNPLYASAQMAMGIASLTGQSYIIYSTAGSEYKGAVEDVANLKGIPAVTCEVVTPHGTIADGSISKSYSQMLAFLRYNNL
ncbi:hypothetical protein LJB96_02865 [Methanobrevibacter sp. OttesenSCG-928-K11]|nr:hypothetical protein [Methanobrevibacter sp. OttesenSCG-928-K11]MDL2270953.1 hypothetical protein [Methanobrevibacter sp. OttesenSCG-928-I08]